MYLGAFSGQENLSGSNNVFLGHNSGYNEKGSNKLYIDNSDTSTPLIWGDFENDKLVFNGNVNFTGNVKVGTSIESPSDLNVYGALTTEGINLFNGSFSGRNRCFIGNVYYR